jgi:2-hydroxy-3-keto-5-methylthiopentenyl-1-phosphate phosphatase
MAHEPNKTIFQCDFDGTATHEDVGFQILDAFADGDWRRLLADYQQGKISVGCFNTSAFTMVKESRSTLVRLVREIARPRVGLRELVEYCRGRGFRFVIVSNGLDFYIRTILDDLGLNGIEVMAARTRFDPKGVDAHYIGPAGTVLYKGFKETYTRFFQEEGYRVIYAGNGPSDMPPARLAKHAFATGTLLDYYRLEGLKCTPFTELADIVKGLERL